ncbi:putative ankyrin repeat protein [Triangularia setosa]|uniref:Ankyrin repeat protein n=1 Tax=Triangularia setosa TaxID=2587417 RepID=A0AAN6VZ80_9PEZI|nr:putative ankyrin repeat protein [Podospora setosa]
MVANMRPPSHPFHPPSPPASVHATSSSFHLHPPSPSDPSSSHVQPKSAAFAQDVHSSRGEENSSTEGPDFCEDDFQAQHLQHTGHNVHSNSNMGYQHIGVMNLLTKDHRTGAESRDPDCLTDKQPLDWLSTVNHHAVHVRALESRVKGTDSWLLSLDDLKEWQTCPGSFLWLHGKQLCGKTVLCASIIEKLESEAPAEVPAVAYYYLNSNEPCIRPGEDESCQESLSERLLRCWLRQLCEGLPHLPKAVQELRQEFKKSGSIGFTRLKDAMRRLADERRHVYLVIDGLDILAESYLGKTPLTALFELLEWFTENDAVHLLVVSRDHTEDIIDETCWDLTQREWGFDIKVQGPAHTKGIELMVDKELSKSTWGVIRKNHPEWINIIKKNLVENSDGIFGLVKLRLLDPEFHELVRRRDPTPSEDEVLDALNASPKGINALYDKALERVCSTPNADMSLQWLMCAIRPLRSIEFEELINWNQTNKMDSISIRHSFGSLVAFSESSGLGHDKTVDFVFSSLKVYLVKQVDECGGLSVVHLMIAKQCVEYINECVTSADEHSAFEDDEGKFNEGKTSECSLRRRPLLEYAINNWYKHVLKHLEYRQDVQLLPHFVPANQAHGSLLTWLRRLYNYWSLSIRNILHIEPHTLSVPGLFDRTLNPTPVEEWIRFTKRMLQDLGHNTEEVRRDLKKTAYRCFELMTDLLIQHQAPLESEASTHTPLQAACMGEFNLLIYSLLQNSMDTMPEGKIENSYSPETERLKQNKAAPDPNNPWWPEDDCTTKGNIAGYDGSSMVRALLLAGANVDKPSSHGDTALHHAMAKGNLGAVTLLLQKNAEMEVSAKGPLNVFETTDIQAHDSAEIFELNWSIPKICHGTPLHWGIETGQHNSVQFLLGQGADGRNLLPVSGRTALHAAALFSDAEMAKLVFEHDYRLNDRDVNGFSPLHFAVIANHLDVVEFLLANGAEVEIPNNIGATPLMFTRHIDTARVLLRNGANWDYHIAPYKPLTALTVAAFSGYHEIVRVLLDKGAPVSAHAMKYATCNGHSQVIQVLVDNDVPVDIPLDLKSGTTALAIAAGAGHSDIASILLNTGASLYPKHPFLGSMLSATSFGGENMVFEACWEQEPSMQHEKDAYGRTALHFAALGGKEKMAAKLLSLGYKASTKDCQGRNALHFAASSGSLSAVEMLLKEQSKINLADADKDGWTALHWAARSGKKKVVERLLDVYLRAEGLPYNKEWPPARIAIYYGHQDLLPLLEGIETGPDVISESERHWWSPGIMHKGYPCDSCLLVRLISSTTRVMDTRLGF